MATLPPISALRDPNAANIAYVPVASTPGQAAIVTPVATKDSFVTYIVIFVVIAIIAYLILWAWNPSWLQRPNTTSLDIGKALLAAIIIALVLTFIYWIIRSCSKNAV